jgi:hypothetical protein
MLKRETFASIGTALTTGSGSVRGGKRLWTGGLGRVRQ